MGKHHFTLQKARSPGRWLQLYKENTTKPLNYKLWLTHHEKHVKSLWEFENDEMDEFEGWQWMEDKWEEYEEYMRLKKMSRKGPIPLEKKKKKKGGKKGKKRSSNDNDD